VAISMQLFADITHTFKLDCYSNMHYLPILLKWPGLENRRLN